MSSPKKFFLLFPLFIIAFLCQRVLPPAQAQSPVSSRILSNDSFDAVASVPLSAVTKRDVAPTRRAERARAEQIFRKLGALGPNTPLVRTRLLLPDGDAASTPGATDYPNQAAPFQLFRRNNPASAATRNLVPRGAPLQFTFTNFEAAQVADFQAFLQTAYPLMVAVYGEPAPIQQGRTVKVQFDANAGDGFYRLPTDTNKDGVPDSATDGGTIFYDPVFAGSGLTQKQARDINNYNLTRQFLIAFHGPLIFAFDAWELGFSDAAALVVNYQQQGSRADFDPSQLGSYLLPAYDFFNQPELGNPIFFSANTSPNLGFFRAAMAQAAWLKAYIENPNFFKNFNAAYYAKTGTSIGVPLAGNTPELKLIAAGVTPTVEGLPFNDWYRRQFVLDTSITIGEKLWAGLQPLANLTSGDTRSVFFGVAQHYRTAANGTETPLGGTGTVQAFNENGVEVTNNSAELSADNRLVFNNLGEAEVNSQGAATGQLPVAGFSNIGAPPTQPEQARLSIVFQIGNARTTAYFPYNVAGTTTQPSGFYGATLGATSGTIQVKVNGGSTASATLARAAFKSSLTYPSGPRVQTDFTVQPTGGGATRVVRRNSAWAYFGGRTQSLGVLLETAPSNNAFTLNLTTSGNNKLRMFSLPFTPIESDEAAVLGVPPASLLLARYRPNLSPRTVIRNGITYGVTADKHEIYPNISQPFGPGRGYWLKVNAAINKQIRGGEPTRSQPYEVPILGGWNQIGTPYNLPFEVGALKVSLAGGTPVSFATAVVNRWVAPGIWRWKPEGGYARVDTGAASSQVLQPFEGYYVFTTQERGVSLIFDSSARTRSSTLTTKTDTSNWKVSLSASTQSTLDADNAFGVTTVTAMGPANPPAAKPPAGTRSLTLSFHSGGTLQSDSTRAGHESGWADSFVPPFEEEEQWNFQVDGAQPGEIVRLNWGETSSLPRKLECTLVDLSSGKRVSMNDRSEWSFTASTLPHQFAILARVTEHSSDIAYFKNYLFRNSQLVIFTAAFRKPGTVRLQIQTPDGETVRTLVSGQQVGTERYLWNWDGLNDAGQRVRGSFTARLEFLPNGGSTQLSETSFRIE